MQKVVAATDSVVRKLCLEYTFFIRKWLIRKRYSASKNVIKVQYWILETQESCEFKRA